MDAAVSLRELTRDFGELRAVDRLTWDVARGELFGIVGPDGAGKTTTLRMLAGVLRPTSGDATVSGLSIAHEPEAVKHQIAYMSQRFGLYTDLTVRENIDFYADLYRVPRKERSRRIERLYQFSGLGPFENRLAGQLSGGMKQKLGLCAALIHEPAILLLDEPTFGVDPISRRDLWLIVHEMVARGVTVLVSTAYMDEAERCDRVAFLHNGQNVLIDTPDRLQARLRGHVLAIRTAAPRRGREWLRDHPLVRQAVLFGDTIHITLREGVGSWPSVRAELESAGIGVSWASPVEPSLEDVFIDVVQSAEADDG
ncbi:MAG: ABC transporter ATP-binding protein [Gemmatimonadales bacterium]|jgi:ABC-2 type transport system ATP-binding protein